MNIRKGVIATTLALAVSVTGISSNAAHASGEGSHHRSDSDSSKAETSKATITAIVSGVPGQTEPVTVTADGALNYKTQQGAFTVAEPDGAGGTLSTEMILDGTSVYTKVPEEALMQTGGKPWVKTDTIEEGQSLGIDLDLLNDENGMESLEAIATEVTKVGKERIRGVKTKHYEVTLDFAAAAEKETDPAAKESLTNIAALYGNTPVVADVWVDRKDRIRQISFTIDLSAMQIPNAPAEEHLTGTIDLKVEFYEFGTDVEVTVPPADQVVTAVELLAQQEASPAPAAA